MGVKNRERRRAKQKVRQQRRREQQQPWFDGGESFPFDLADLPDLADLVAPPAEDVAALLGHAQHLVHCDDHDDSELARCLDTLAARRSEAERPVMSRLQQAVTTCWPRGWQPADLVRVVGRRAGARPARLATDAIAAEMRAYASATVDPQWAAQLDQLEATVWWERDDRFLEQWAARHRVPLAEVFGCVAEVLAWLGQLPALPQLVPPPGTARARPATPRGEAPVNERMLDRVRALLAKAESTTFPEEAETYTAKAQELMARHSIDHALLAAGAPAASDAPAGRRLGVDNPYEQAKALLLDCVARANRCRTVWHKDLGFSTVMGFPTDLDAVELLYTSLLVQATAAMLHEGSRRDRSGRSRTRSFRQSFLTAYATRIGERLRSATETVTQEAAAGAGGSDLLPVLAARGDRVDEATEEMFPELVTRAVRATDREGWVSGTAAADRASLGIRHHVGEGRSGS